MQIAARLSAHFDSPPTGSFFREVVVEVFCGDSMGVNTRRRHLAPEPYSLGHLRVLFQRLIDAQEGRGEGETTVVETLRAISEVVVYGENQDAKLAAKAAKAEAIRLSQGEGEEGEPLNGKTGEVSVADIRRQDAFFELFCEKNMMSRFIELLRSPPSRYQTNNGSGSYALRSSGQSSNLQTWGTNGGLDAMVRALTWGGDVLRIGHQQQQHQKMGAGVSGRVEGAGGARGAEERSSAQVQVQVIQTTSILVMNVKSDTSLFYLLSNNHVNDMIMFDFRLEDEEVLSHFASFLKTLSLRLNPDTVQFFLRSPRQRQRADLIGRLEASHSNGGEGDSHGDSHDVGDGHHGEKGGADRTDEEEAMFPLYTRALEYICHSDFHVRIAALTVVLNIYKQRDPLVRAYLNGPAARSASLPERLVGALRSQCLVLADRAMSAGMTSPAQASGGVALGEKAGTVAPRSPASTGCASMATVDPGIFRDSIAGLQDQVFYLEDVFSSGQGELNAQLSESLVNRLVRPMLLGDWLSGRPGAMFPQVALCALAQLFIVVTYPPLVRLLVVETLGTEAGGPCPLLALLQGDREDLCLGALVVIQALAQNRVVRDDLGLSQNSAEGGAGGPPVFDDGTSTEGFEDGDAYSSSPGIEDDFSHHEEDALSSAAREPLCPEILESTVDALCHMLTPGDPSPSRDVTSSTTVSESGAATSYDCSRPRPVAGPRRHHLVIRLCGKVLESLAPPPLPSSPSLAGANDDISTLKASNRESIEGASGRAGSAEEKEVAERKASELRATVLRQIGKAHSAAAALVLTGVGETEGASCIVVFEEEIREWSERTGLDSAITNLPKMSSLILRWSLDKSTSVSHRRQQQQQEQHLSVPSGSRLKSDAIAKTKHEGEGCETTKRMRELRSSLQAFLEIRQVRRLLLGKGETDSSVLSIAGLGPESEEEQPREGGSLDLGGRECLACSIPNPAPRTASSSSTVGSSKGRGEKGARESRNGMGSVAALSVAAVAGRRGRSELYLVLDAKAFLLATPDRRRLTNGEVKSAAPLIHLAAAPDPADETRLHIRALSHRPVALMRPVTPPRSSNHTPLAKSEAGSKGHSHSQGQGTKAAARVKVGVGGSGSPIDGGVTAAGGGDAGSMCDLQAWECELAFENARSCRLARKHMEGRRLRLRSEKIKLITDLLEACVQGRDN